MQLREEMSPEARMSSVSLSRATVCIVTGVTVTSAGMPGERCKRRARTVSLEEDLYHRRDGPERTEYESPSGCEPMRRRRIAL